MISFGLKDVQKKVRDKKFMSVAKKVISHPIHMQNMNFLSTDKFFSRINGRSGAQIVTEREEGRISMSP